MSGAAESELNVSGATLYIDDLPDARTALQGTIWPTPSARGRLFSVDTSAALASHPSVRVITAADIPGENQIGSGLPDEPLLIDGEWRFKGQALALVLAESASLARKAARLLHIEAEDLPPITDPRDASAAGDLILPPRTMRYGDTDAAFAQCEVVVEGRVESAGQEHVYLETQGALAERGEGGRMHVVSGTQWPSGVQAAVARVLGLPLNAVEVEVRRLGGSFGGKEDQGTGWAALAALGAALTGERVEIHLSRNEDMRWTGKRHPYSTDFRMGLDADGHIMAFEADYYQNSGACCDLSPAILARTLFHAVGAYRIPNVRVTGRACRTNLPPFTAFRGFGAPQALFVMECALDAAAVKGGWEPAALRRKNLLRDGDTLHYGQLVGGCSTERSFDRLLELAHWDTLRSEIESFNGSHALTKKGAALLPLCFGVSFTKLVMNQGGALVHVYRDGTVSVTTSAVEMGQQVARKIQIIAARSLGIGEDLVRVGPTSTSTVANTYPTAASTGTDINGMAALAAFEEIRGRLLTVAAASLGAERGELDIEGGAVTLRRAATSLAWPQLVELAHLERVDLSAHGFYATPGIFYDGEAERGSPFAYHVFGCGAVVAELDVLRGTYSFEWAYLVHDAGESLDRSVDLGQAEGAFAQGLGWATLEDLRYDDAGSLLTDTLSTYKVPDIRFIPSRLVVEFLSDAGNPKAVMRSKGIGEPPFMYGIAGYFAVLDALRATRSGSPTGAAAPGMYDLPMTPEKALDYIQGLRP
jgi:xanthine dehydrogenase large subunit